MASAAVKRIVVESRRPCIAETAFSVHSGRSSSSFCSFEEARKFVRQFNLSNHREWLSFCTSERPKFIPSQPGKVYKTKWIDWPDFLGYQRIRHSYVEETKSAANAYRRWRVDGEKTNTNPMWRNQEAAATVDWLVAELSRGNPDIEFSRTPHPYKCDLLYRLKSSTEIESESSTAESRGQAAESELERHQRTTAEQTLWIPLQIQGTKNTNANRKVGFRYSSTATDTGLICVNHAADNEVYMMRNNEMPSTIRHHVYPLSKHKKNTAAEISSQLRAWWTEIPGNSLDEVVRKMAYEQDYRRFLLEQQAAQCLFAPVSLSWAHTGISHSHNFSLGDYKVLGKKGRISMNSGGSKTFLGVCLERKFNCVTIPLDSSDEIDFVIVFVPSLQDGSETDESCDLHGVFILPLHFLGDFLSSAESVGKKRYRMYPPFLCATRSQARKRKETQAPYYYDLSTPELACQSQQKLREFLKEYGPSRFP